MNPPGLIGDGLGGSASALLPGFFRAGAGKRMQNRRSDVSAGAMDGAYGRNTR
jgi:hypothetical protein